MGVCLAALRAVSRTFGGTSRANGTCSRASMRRLLLTGIFLLATALPARAVTLSDLIDLSRAGLSDDILIELVEAERSVFHLDAQALKALKAEGLSDRLLLHLLRTPSLREAERQPVYEPALSAPPPAPQPAPTQVVVIDRVEPVAVPIYVPVYIQPTEPERPTKPVYWGYGGKRRPDSWRK